MRQFRDIRSALSLDSRTCFQLLAGFAGLGMFGALVFASFIK